MSGVGISVDRIYLVVEELNLFRKRSPNHQKRCLLITAIPKVLRLAIQKLKSGIKVELYPDKSGNSFNMLIREVFLCSNSRGTNKFILFSEKLSEWGTDSHLTEGLKGVIVILIL
jgi:hypothetical protein